MFKSIKQKFHIIVGVLILLVCVGYAELAVFLNKLRTSSETVQVYATINKDIKKLEKDFWELRFWEKVVNTRNHPNAEKQFGITIEKIKKRLLLLNPKLFTEQLSGKTLQIFRLIVEYKNAFDQLMQYEADQKANRIQTDSSYNALASVIQANNEADFYRLLGSIEQFTANHQKNRGDPEYQAFRTVFELLKEKFKKQNLMNARVESDFANLEHSATRDFMLEKEMRLIYKRLDEISMGLTGLFSNISQSAEKLSTKAISTGKRLRDTLHLWFLVSAGIAFILLLVIINIIAKTIVNPIRQMSEVVTEIKSGNDQARFSSGSGDEIAELGFAFNDMLETISEHHYHLEELVEKRTAELNKTLEKVEEANKKIMDSLQYAKMIQRSMLTNLDMIKIYLPDSFFVWMPRDIVSGDIFFTDSFDDGFVIAVLDCTGHGIPGAFMTMIASSGLTRIIRNEKCHDPAQVLKQLNFTVKTSLQQDTEYAVSDDGLDAAICLVNTKEKTLVFAGARLPLVYVHNDTSHIIKGDRQSLGYRKSNTDFNFTNQTISIEQGMSFYMLTDGFIDQLGGEKNRRFGTRRFRNLAEQISRERFEKQGEMLLQTFNEYQGENERQDDVTVIGFAFNDYQGQT
ncbi:SpoIIE family protein phosphatase [Desulfonema magnum]|uniref:SpoIIE family protein phosphatase n=1 Tax=Desulfonema magnum TaxID=45655 RepID=UPI001A9B7FD9|nr:SpoIIE family protein phosphatase [Desulfonema magnum]